MIFDALTDALLDTAKLLPFLFATYLFMEFLEHGAGERFERAVAKAGSAGPFIGAALGLVPQCGFSGAAATLYAGRVITLGTLIAIFLATSDEMLPILLAAQAPVSTVAKLLAIKFVAGLAIGLALDFILKKTGRLHTGLAAAHKHAGHEGHDIHSLCHAEGCDCCEHCDCCHCDEEAAPEQVFATEPSANTPGAPSQVATPIDPDAAAPHGHSPLHLARAAARHTLKIAVFVLVIIFALNLVLDEGLNATTLAHGTALSIPLAAALGLIPNCAVSLAVTQLYLTGALPLAPTMAALLSNAGVGVLVLLRTNRDAAENLRIVALLALCAMLVGFLLLPFS